MAVPPCTRRRGFALAALALFVLARTADAQNDNWTGGGADGNWSTALNWTGSVLPTSANTINFGSTVTNTANLTTNNNLLTSVLGIAVGQVGGTAGATPITISGNSLTLTSAATSIQMSTNSATQDLTFNLGSNDLTLAPSTGTAEAWMMFGARNLTINSNHIYLSNTTTGNTLSVTLTAVTGTLALNGIIADSSAAGASPSGLTFTSANTNNGAAVVQFLQANTYTGPTLLNAGGASSSTGETYQIGSDSAFGVGGTVTNTLVGKVPMFQAINGNHTISNPIFLNGGFAFTGSNNLTFGGAVTAPAGKAFTYNMPVGTSEIFNGPVTMGTSGSAAGTLTTSVSTGTTTAVGMIVFNGVLSEAAGSASGLTVLLSNGNNAGTVFSTDEFNNQNTYSGGTTMSGQGCQVIVGSSSQGPAGAPTSGPLGTGTVLVNDSTQLPKIQATNGAQTVGNNFTLTSGLVVQGTNNLTLTGTLSGGGSLVKIGTSALSLTGANTYTATALGTQITGGALLAMNGSNGSATGTSLVTATGTGTTAAPNVGNGGILGGTGTITGNITISSTTTGSYGGVIYPGPENGTAGTLNVGSMSWQPFGRYVFAYNPTNVATGGGVNNFINGAGTLDLSTLSTSPFDLNLLQLTPVFTSQTSQTYTIASFAGGVGVTTGTDISGDFTFSGAFSGTPDAVVVAGAGGGSAQAIQLTFIPAVTPPPTSFTWTGSVSGSWMNANNWNPVFTPTSNANNQLTFGATPNPTMTDDISGALSLNSMTFNAGSPAYSLAAGAGNSLNFVTNSSGTLPTITSSSTNTIAISAPITLTNNMTLTAQAGVTLSGLISGAGSLTYSGTGTLTLASGNTYSGGTNVLSGTISVPTDSALGTGTVTGSTLGTLSFTGTTATTKSFAMNGGTITVASGQTVTFNGSQVTGATLDGSGTFATNAAIVDSGNSTASVAIASNSAKDQFVHFTNNGALTFAAGLNPSVSTAISNLNGFINQGSGAVTIGAGSAINAANFQSYGTLTVVPNTTSAPTVFTNTGTATLGFNGGSRTFIGTSATADPTGQNIVDYVDLHGQNAIVTDGLFVNNGGVFDTVGAGTHTIIADFGSLVKGAGFYQNTVKTQNGGKFQTGNSPGSATFGNFVFGPGGVSNYIFAIDDATGTAGPSPGSSGLVSGWGLIKAVQVSLATGTTSGNFTWTATPTNPLSVAIDTLVNPTMVGTDVAGPMADFDPTQAYSWTAAHWTGNYAGPTDVATLDADTSFNTTGFANPIAGTFGWSLDPADQTLSLVYTPSAVPEPGSLALMGAAAIAASWRLRRRRD